MTAAHAFFPPSGAAETVACARWPLMNAMFPKPDTQDSLDGTAVHWAGAELVQGRPMDEGVVAPNGVVLTGEMVEAAETWASTLHGQEWVIETPVGDRNSMNWGTPDAYRLEPTVRRVKDLKFGFKPVDAFEWWQGINYAKLIQRAAPLPDEGRFEFEIVQPRVYRRRDRNVWSATVAQLRPYWERIDAAHAAALEPHPVATAGLYCEYCPGRHLCPTLQAAALTIAGHSGDGTPMELTDDAIGREAVTVRRAIAIMSARLTGLEADIDSRIRAGHRVPWHMLKAGESREAFTVPAVDVIEFGNRFGVDLSKLGTVTPNQAREALAAAPMFTGVPKKDAKTAAAAMVAEISHRPPAGMKLVEDDGRAAAKAFDGAVQMS